MAAQRRCDVDDCTTELGKCQPGTGPGIVLAVGEDHTIATPVMVSLTMGDLLMIDWALDHLIECEQLNATEDMDARLALAKVTVFRYTLGGGAA
jgi:hypothetical protein